jgi:hypothetical protein
MLFDARNGSLQPKQSLFIYARVLGACALLSCTFHVLMFWKSWFCFQIVSPACAERTAESLGKICVDEGSVLLKLYDVAHAVTDKEILDIIEFMVSKSDAR